jgi:hypothetical protein
MATQIKLRRDTAANWASEDPVLASGEPGYDITNNILKIGDGSSAWTGLASIYDPSTDIVPAADNTYDLGSPDKQWRHVYTAGGSIYLDNIKLTNVNGKFVATTVVNPGQENEEEDPEDSNAASEIGGGVDGLSGNIITDAEVEGDTRYELGINEDITLKIYQGASGPGNLGPGISLGEGIGDPHRTGVIAIGNDDVGYNSKAGGVYIGAEAGWNDTEDPQGEYAIAIGARAARNFAPDNSITLNATGENLDPTADGLYIKPVREDVENTEKAVYYNTTTGELTYADPTSGGATVSDVWVQTFVTDLATDIVQAAASVEYDAAGNLIALFNHVSTEDESTYYSVGKYTTTGTRLWTVRFANDFNTDGWGLAVDQSNGFVYKNQGQ